MSLAEFKTIFTTQFLKQIKNININGNYGDFVTARDGLEILRYAKQINPFLRISISTNGSAKSKIWTELAKLKIAVRFRLDGLADTHCLYRQDTNYNAIIENACSFINAGGVAEWAMIEFDHNKHQIDECRNLSKELGFKSFQLINQGRDTMPVFNRDKSFSHVIGKFEGPKDFQTLFDRRQLYKQDPGKTVRENKTSNNISCQVIGPKEIYITATGEVYPCCWLGHYPLHSLAEPTNIQLKEIVYKNNALEYGLEQAIEWFSKVKQSWDYENVSAGKLYACNEVCGKKI
jgi:MoaA/NifB/PqqE/SkfB family radical SAM enzyme